MTMSSKGLNIEGNNTIVPDITYKNVYVGLSKMKELRTHSRGRCEQTGDYRNTRACKCLRQ